jgi:hypothetical protein
MSILEVVEHNIFLDSCPEEQGHNFSKKYENVK